ncbi:MAG: hypothetical protein ABIR84_13930 [Candidatus Nitrotoga sp.]
MLAHLHILTMLSGKIEFMIDQMVLHEFKTAGYDLPFESRLTEVLSV